MIITNQTLADWWQRKHLPAPGTYEAPVATVVWDGIALTCTPTGQPLEPFVALYAPGLARDLEQLLARRGVLAPAPIEPQIAALEMDYDAATAPFRDDVGTVATAETFMAKLTRCRGCRLWSEAARGGRGRCESVRLRCSRRLLWRAKETCPEGKWPA